MKTLFILSFLFLISSNTFAAVWEDTQTWSLQYEEEYSKWMQSPAVHETLFTDSKSPYFGVSTDCADTAYALRAIFAFEHKLPFAIYSPSGSRDSNKTLNNRNSHWDSAGNETQRLVAMINEIGDSVGTENLAYFDTYPTALKSISSGSLFLYKIKARFGKFIRHTYNIKAVSDIGTFDVIYSTQANKAKGLPLIRRKDYEFDKLPNNPWGFKKFRWPEHLGLEISALPKDMNASEEQFVLAKDLGDAGFFKYVKKTLSTSNENPVEVLTRTFKAVCSESQARIMYVNQALDHLKETGNKCMNYEEFDAYSTPARDQTLKELFIKLQNALSDVVAGKLNGHESQAYAESIFKKTPSLELAAACPIAYRPGVSIDLATLWKRLDAGILSSHPNDTVEYRWGEKSLMKTWCKRWY